MTLSQLLANARRLESKKEVFRIGFEIIKALEAYLIDLQQIQLEQGKNNEGLELGRYSAKTEALSRTNPAIMPKRAGDPYNFQWTGAFFRGMRLRVLFSEAEAFFVSEDPKFDLLEDKYPGLMGLTDEAFAEAVRNKILPEFIERCRQLLTTSNS